MGCELVKYLSFGISVNFDDFFLQIMFSSFLFQMAYKTLDKVYNAVLHNRTMVDLYEKNLVGFVTEDMPRNRSALCGSTDMGNVSHIVPSIHPHFYIGGVGVNHTRGFTSDAGTFTNHDSELSSAISLTKFLFKGRKSNIFNVIKFL